MDSAYARLRRYKVRTRRPVRSGCPRPSRTPPASGRSTFAIRTAIRSRSSSSRRTRATQSGTPPTNRLFLGIDHTAIVVADTRASLAFYRDVLGFRVAGESMNAGTEQEHLNNVKGARLHITSLRAPSGPGIEFLEYDAPRDGRPYPADERPNDLVHWQTTVLVPDADAAAAAVRRGSFRLLSSSAIALPDTTLGFSRGLLVRDPDGHAVQLVEHEGVAHAQQ